MHVQVLIYLLRAKLKAFETKWEKSEFCMRYKILSDLGREWAF